MDLPPFSAFLGIEVTSDGEGTARASLELRTHHLNRRGVAHGGIVTALLDSALGAAVISTIPREWWCATTSLSTQYLDGAGSGRLIATGRVDRRGAKIAFASGEVRDEHGRRIASAQGTWHLWSHRPGLERTGIRPFVEVRGTGERLRVGKILAIGRNYAAHAAEMGAESTESPIVFLKPSSALVHDGARIRLPVGAGTVHHEVELVVAIGRGGRDIPEKRALEHVLGFAVGLDLTLRDLQSEAKRRGEPWSLAKGFDGSAPVSSVVRREDVGDGSGLAITLDINDRRVQQGSTARMLHSVPRLVAFASRWMSLERGDLLFTGTPEGVGPVRPGDRLLASVERVGTLRVEMSAD